MVENPSVIIDTRVLNRQPSDEMEALRAKWHYLYQRRAMDESSLCSSSTMNFLGALIVESVKTQILAQFDGYTKQTRPHQGLLDNLQEVRTVTLWRREPPSNTPLKIEASHVLVKNDPGKVAGVVLSGPYTGLLLEEKVKDRGIQNGMTINRIWNEDPTETTPYRPKLYNTDGEENEKAYEIYHEKRDTILALRTSLPLSEIFLLLLKELAITVDKKAFHTSDKFV